MQQSTKRKIFIAFVLCLFFVGMLSPSLSFASSPKVSAQTSDPPSTILTQILLVNSMNNASTQWQTDGKCPYLNNATGKHDIYLIGGPGQNGKIEGRFGFPKLSVLYSNITKVFLNVESSTNGTTLDFNRASVYNSSGLNIGVVVPGTSYSWTRFDITSNFNTIPKVNQASIYFNFTSVSNNKPFLIDRMYLNVTGTIYPQTSLSRWTQLLWNNETTAQVNSTFPFVRLGSESLTSVSEEQLLTGALLSMQTGDNSSLQQAESVCVWLNQTAIKKHVWFTYNSSSGWQTTPIGSNVGASVIQRLAVYAYQVPKWKPLLQQIVNEWIRIYLPLSTARVHFEVWPDDTVFLDPGYAYRDYCVAPYQSASIVALTLASAVLGNATLKNLAYRMIMNYTNYDPIHAPHHLSTHAIYPNGTLDLSTYYFSKEDEDYANYMAAMETFYYYYPQNITIKSRIYDQAWDGAQDMWNSTGLCWNYKTNIRSGSLDLTSGPPYLAVHGFGMTDEVLIGAYLIFGNTTWLSRARQDFDSLVIQGKIMTHGLIDHSTYHPKNAQEDWNVQDRRTAVILCDIFNNQTYLKWANMLFWNVTGQMARKYGLAEEVDPTTDADAELLNTREDFGGFLRYVNKTVTVTSFHSLFTALGLPVTGISPPPPPKWLSVTLNGPNGISQTSLSVTFSYTPYVVGAAIVNASLWTNSSGVWQRVMTNSTPQNLTQTSFRYSYGSHGTYVWSVKVYNSTMGVFAPANFTISLMSVSISPASVTMDYGQSRLFTSSITGGIPPFTIYQWYLNAAPVSGATGSTWMFTPPATGSYSVFVNATDSYGTMAESNAVLVIVNPPPTVSIPPMSVTMDVGQSHLFTSNVSGGTPPYSYQWCLNNAPVSGATFPSWTFSPSSPGSYAVYLNVTDSVGYQVKSNVALVTVNPPPSVTISPSSATLNIGQSQSFASSVSGGTPPYSYQWYLNGNPVSGATNQTWTFTPSSPGSYDVYVNVTDDVGFIAKSNVALIVANQASAVTPIGGVVGITGYKLVFNETMNNSLDSSVTIDYYWNFSIDEWNGTQWVASGISGSSATVTGYVMPANTTVDLPYYVYLLNSSAAAWGDWLRINYTFHWTYSGTNYSTDYEAKLHVHPADFAGVAPVTFPYLGADGKVGTTDLHVLGVQWGQNVPLSADPTSDVARADVNGDGKVGTADLHILGVEWGLTWTNTPPG